MNVDDPRSVIISEKLKIPRPIHSYVCRKKFPQHYGTVASNKGHGRLYMREQVVQEKSSHPGPISIFFYVAIPVDPVRVVTSSLRNGRLRPSWAPRSVLTDGAASHVHFGECEGSVSMRDWFLRTEYISMVSAFTASWCTIPWRLGCVCCKR